MHLKSDNIEIMIKDIEDEVVENIFEPLFNRYQIGLEASLRGSNFFFDCVHWLYCECH